MDRMFSNVSLRVRARKILISEATHMVPTYLQKRAPARTSGYNLDVEGCDREKVADIHRLDDELVYGVFGIHVRHPQPRHVFNSEHGDAENFCHLPEHRVHAGRAHRLRDQGAPVAVFGLRLVRLLTSIVPSGSAYE